LTLAGFEIWQPTEQRPFLFLAWKELKLLCGPFISKKKLKF